MKIVAAPLAGVFVIEPEPIGDDRGHFTRLYCRTTFAEHGLDPTLDQISMSLSRRRGTLRGMHIQRPPHGEAKLVRVTAGAIYDVAVDLRAGSPAFGTWFATELSAENGRLLYVPKGFAHGFQTLAADTAVTYHISTSYAPASATGVRWNDADLAVAWPDPAGAFTSERDGALPLLREFEPILC